MKRALAITIGLFLLPVVAHATVIPQQFTQTYTCTGSAGPFPFNYPLSAPPAMTVTKNGVLLASTSYTIVPVNNNYDNGGSVTLLNPCPAGQTLVLKRATPLTQTQVFTDNMPVPMKSFENGLDKAIEILQEQAARLIDIQAGFISGDCPNLVFAGGRWIFMDSGGPCGTGGGGGQTTLALTTNGTSGPSTLAGTPIAGYTLNVPVYGSGFQTQIIPPAAGQYVVVYPTAVVKDADTAQVSLVADATSGEITRLSSCPLCTPYTRSITWSGFSLPAGVNPANVTAIYATTVAGLTGGASGIGLHSSSCTSGSQGATLLSGLNVLTPLQQYTAAVSGPPTTFDFAGASCITSDTSSTGYTNTTQWNTNAIAFIVYYTGTPVPLSNALIIAPRLSLNSATNTLGVDVTGLGGGGSGGVSGQAAGVVGLAGSATTTSAQSHINENTSGQTEITQKTVVNDGTGNSGAYQPRVGTDAGGVTGTATYTTDATNGYAEVHEGTASLARICTASNGVCAPGTGTVTSVAETVPSWLSISGSPITTSGTLAVTAATGQTSHQVIGTCGSATSFSPCALTLADLGYTSTGSGTVLVLATSPTLVTPNIGAATGTSLLATGIVDGTTPVTITTGSSATLGSTYNSGYTYNQNATAATAVAYTLPTAAAGKQFCTGNSYNGSAANTGVLTVNTSASGQFIIFTDGTLSATGGNVTSGGAGGDSACFVGVDSTHWQIYVQQGTWTKH